LPTSTAASPGPHLPLVKRSYSSRIKGMNA
jgi:hypothetical protein